MTVWISKVKLENFKAYKEAEFEFPEPNEKNGNIILVGAENKSGKTSFLEALYLGFYGETKESIKNISRNSGTGDKFEIRDFLFSQAEEIRRGDPEYNAYNSYYRMLIQIEFCWKIDDKINKAKIIRRWNFKKNKDIDNNSSLYFLWNNENNNWIRLTDNPEDKFKSETEEYLVRVEHSAFFLFNAAKLDSNTIDNQTINKWISKGLRDLTGITILDNKEDGEKKGNGIKQEIYKEIQEEAKKINGDKAKQQELEILEEKLDDLKNNKNKLNNNLKKIKEELDSLDDEIKSVINKLGVSDVNEFIKQSEKLIDLDRELKSKEEEIQNNLKNFSLLFLSNNIINEFSQELNKEAKLLELELAREQLEPKVEDLAHLLWESQQLLAIKMSAQYEQKNLEEVREDFYNLVSESVKKIWEPEKNELAKYIRHNYISLKNHNEIAMTIQDRKMPNRSIIDLIYQTRDIQSQLNELRENLKNSNKENLGKDETEKLEKKHSEILEKIKSKEREKRDLEKELEILNKNITQTEQEIENITISITGSNRIKFSRLNKIFSAIEEISNKLSELKSTQVENNVNEIHQEISNDENILMNVSNYEIKFLGAEGNKLDFKNFSSGQKQVIICSLIFALAKTTGSLSPLVIDTPLGLLSKNYHNNFIKYLASLPQQIILTPHDKEIDKEEYLSLKEKGYIQETYLITAEKLSDGNKKSTVERGKFFEF